MAHFASPAFFTAPLSLPMLHTPRPAALAPTRRSVTRPLRRDARPLVMRLYSNRNNQSPRTPIPDRILSTLPYVIPLLDSLTFGKYVFSKVPLLSTLLLTPLYPLYTLYRGVPFLAFGVFLALFLLVVRNTQVSRYIRFNTYQALVIDIALIFPQLFQGANLGSVIPPQVAEICSTAVFYAVAFAVVYAVVANARGRLPDEIPGVSDSVYQQLGPF
eukprot:GFKZ01000252.1.p1 GENE.GFKZ01000252.1~~GFKZ01000252.1.p1  ORF type:complete len:235 (+),score=17.47 GFKZ01000252.1:59-706(+)